MKKYLIVLIVLFGAITPNTFAQFVRLEKYPDIPVPNKVPMPRPVDAYFKTWEGPSRPEFRRDIDMSKFNGNQKWQMYCLERFLDINEKV